MLSQEARQAGTDRREARRRAPAHPIESLEDAVLYGTQMDVLEQLLILSA